MRRTRYDRRTAIRSIHCCVCSTGTRAHFMARRRRGSRRSLTHPAYAQYPWSPAPVAYGSGGWHRTHGPHAPQDAHNGCAWGYTRALLAFFFIDPAAAEIYSLSLRDAELARRAG